jgi:tRNA dimethylallyltransferase
LHPRDARRVIRALEVLELTGQSITDLQQQFDRARPAESCRVFVLDWPPEELGRRIDSRVESMFSAGFLEETRALVAGPHPPGRTAGQAVGYREVIAHLDGAGTLAETIELVKLRTRQFAKRQRTWFRSLTECRFLAASDSPARIAEQLAANRLPGK